MQNFFGIEFDTTNMTLEELEETRTKILELLKNVDYQLALRKMSNRNHASSN